MMNFACLCGYREEADRTPLCPECKEDMAQYEPPIVPDNWYTIGQVLRRSPEEVAHRAKLRGRK